MATYDLPMGMQAQAASFGLQKVGVQFRSPFNGSLQAASLAAERWACSLTAVPNISSSAGTMEAFINRLAGGVNKVRVWHPARPVPFGTLRGSPALASGAAVGDLELELTDGNYCTHSQSFDHESWAGLNVFGVVPDQQYSSTGTLTADRATETTADGNHVLSKVVTVEAATGYITISVELRSTRGWVWLQLDEAFGASLAYFQVTGAGAVGNVGGTGSWSNVTASIRRIQGAPGGDWYRCSLTAEKTSSSTSLGFFIGNTTGNATTSYVGSASHSFDMWGAKLERASAPTGYNGLATLSAGDMLGAGGQLFQVAAACQADEEGLMTVPLVNRVRAAIASAAAVTWNKPTAEFVCPAMLNRSVFRPGYMEGAVLDLEEAY